MKIFFSVGEPSGDQHAAHLIEELHRHRPDIECIGYGGPEMEKAGCRVMFPLTDYAVMGIVKVLPLIWKFLRVAFRANKIFREEKPDVVVLVDFPGFNWWIARFARDAGIKVVYYMPPQLWAWAPWRLKRVHRNVDCVLSGLNFETDWYRENGVDCQFVGHPFFDEVAQKKLDAEFIEQAKTNSPQVLGVLPGSRGQEVSRNWPVMIDVLKQIHAEHPDCRFYVANYKEKQRVFCEEMLQQDDEAKQLPIEFHVGKTPEIIELADVCLMVSGSVSLEMMARKTPAVIQYRTGMTMLLAARQVLTCPSMTLPNLIAGWELYREYAFCGRDELYVRRIAGELNHLLSSESARQSAIAEMESLCEKVAQPGATGRAARTILELLPLETSAIEANSGIAA